MSDHAEAASHEKLYWTVGAALFGLTIATVLVSRHHFAPPWGLVIGLAIAFIKAGLVASIFMHLKWESRYIYYFLGLTVAATLVLFALPITDFRLIDASIAERADPKAPAVHGSHAPEGAAAPAEHH